MHPALCDKSAAILTQHSYLREATSVQRIADLPSIMTEEGSVNLREATHLLLMQVNISRATAWRGFFLSGERIEKNN